MSKKFLFTMILLSGALFAVFFKTYLSENTKRSKIGKKLVDYNYFTSIKEIKIKSKNKSVVIRKNSDSRWVITTDNDFPVDASKITSLIDDLSNAKIMHLISIKNIKEFNLDKKDNFIEFKRDKDKKIFYIGKKRGDYKDGVFIKEGSENKIYLIDKNIELNTDNYHWQLRKLLDIDIDLVKSFRFKKEGSDFLLYRSKKDDKFLLKGLEKNQKMKESVNSDLDILSVNFSKRHDLSDENSSKSLKNSLSQVYIELFSGEKIEIKIGIFIEKKEDDSDEKYYMFLSSSKKSSLINNMNKFNYEISSYIAKKFLKKRSDFIEEEKKENK